MHYENVFTPIFVHKKDIYLHKSIYFIFLTKKAFLFEKYMI